MINIVTFKSKLVKGGRVDAFVFGIDPARGYSCADFLLPFPFATHVINFIIKRQHSNWCRYKFEAGSNFFLPKMPLYKI